VLGERGAGEIYLHRVLDACVFRVLADVNSHSTGLVDFDCIPSVTLVSDTGDA
jgi:lipopolysaccharide transport system ATP-binding protein